jgi:hypothetical protein
VTFPGIVCLLFGRSARSVVITPTNNDNSVTVAMFMQLTALLLHLNKPNKNTEESHVHKHSRLQDIALGSSQRHRTDVIKNAMSCRQSTLLPSVILTLQMLPAVS